MGHRAQQCSTEPWESAHVGIIADTPGPQWMWSTGAYPIGDQIFVSPTNLKIHNLATTYLQPTHNLPTTWPQPPHNPPKTYPQPTHNPPTTYPQPTHNLPTT